MNNNISLKKHIVGYEKRLVAFFDFQGFRNSILKEYSCEAIGSVFGLFVSVSDKLQKDCKDLKITIISDSIVISTTIEERTNIISFFEVCSYFAAPRIGKEFIAVRGGIAYGDLHHVDNIVFGPALIDAYNLAENQPKPKFLKTLMERTTFDILKCNNDISTMFLYELMLPQQEDDKYYFDFWYFPFLISCDDKNLLDKHVLEMKEYFYWLLLNLNEYIEKDEELFEKYNDLLRRTIVSFIRIKKNQMHQLSNEAKNTVNVYSDINAVKQFEEKYLQQG